MNKHEFEKIKQTIEVPEEDVRQAIRKGILMGKNHETYFKSPMIRPKGIILAVASVGIILSLAIAPVSQAFASIPFIGSLYSQFNDLVGRRLEEQGLVTKINEVSENQGVQIAITEAYYDGGVIGVAFEMNGLFDFEENDRSAFYQIFNGDPNIAETKELIYLSETATGFSGVISIASNVDKLEDLQSVPLEFLRVGKKEGTWKFDIPLQNLPYIETDLQIARELPEENVRLEFESYILGEASVAFDYQTTFLASEKNNQIRFLIYDDQGNEVSSVSTGISRGEAKVDGNLIVSQKRGVILDKIQDQTSYIDIFPVVALIDKDPNDTIPLEPIRIYFDE